jgi:hypothetical protein
MSLSCASALSERADCRWRDTEMMRENDGEKDDDGRNQSQRAKEVMWFLDSTFAKGESRRYERNVVRWRGVMSVRSKSRASDEE